jgi:hypothetical protein
MQSFALDRNAFTITRYDLRATLAPAEQGLEVSGKLTLRNDSSVPQRALSLQISSTLDWQSIKNDGKRVLYVSKPYATDIDHTGEVREAIVSLSGEVAAGSTIELEVLYSGTVPLDSTRLTRIGVPEKAATRSDWDHIDQSFAGVRGVGYVCWYPVALNSVSLSEGSSMFTVLGGWKTRHAGSSMLLTLVVDSDQPAVANGRLISQKATTGEDGTVHERTYEFAPMGMAPPAFALSGFTVLSRPAISVFYLADQQSAAQEYSDAAERLSPVLNDWFGPQQRKVVVVELPEGDAPFDSGPMLFTPFSSDPKAIEVAIAHQLAHARIKSPQLWIDEGLAHFAQALVRERQDGRGAALDYLQQFRPALAEAERQDRLVPAGTGSTPEEGEPLARATDEIYYRGKAMFVWWMLRDMLGDAALQHVLLQYRGEEDKDSAYLPHLVEAQSKRSLAWFFDDWVYHDRGLPDFRVASAFATELKSQEISVTITVQNDGDARAEAPVYIPMEKGQALQRLQIPAHGEASTRITVPAVPQEVIVNDGSIPEANRSNNRFELKSATAEKPATGN